MSGVDIAIIAFVVALFAAALGYIIYRKVKHKGCCDCSDCSACGACKKSERKSDNVSTCCCCKHADELKSE